MDTLILLLTFIIGHCREDVHNSYFGTYCTVKICQNFLLFCKYLNLLDVSNPKVHTSKRCGLTQVFWSFYSKLLSINEIGNCVLLDLCGKFSAAGSAKFPFAWWECKSRIDTLISLEVVMHLQYKFSKTRLSTFEWLSCYLESKCMHTLILFLEWVTSWILGETIQHKLKWIKGKV